MTDVKERNRERKTGAAGELLGSFCRNTKQEKVRKLKPNVCRTLCKFISERMITEPDLKISFAVAIAIPPSPTHPNI